MMTTLGRHVLLELKGCPTSLLDDLEFIERQMLEAARLAKVTIIDSSFHEFNPHGVSGAVIIAESHLSIHTWPEHNYAAIDIFTCGDEVLPLHATEHLSKILKAEISEVIEIDRGIMDENKRILPPRLSLKETSHADEPARQQVAY